MIRLRPRETKPLARSHVGPRFKRRANSIACASSNRHPRSDPGCTRAGCVPTERSSRHGRRGRPPPPGGPVASAVPAAGWPQPRRHCCTRPWGDQREGAGPRRAGARGRWAMQSKVLLSKTAAFFLHPPHPSRASRGLRQMLAPGVFCPVRPRATQAPRGKRAEIPGNEARGAPEPRPAGRGTEVSSRRLGLLPSVEWERPPPWRRSGVEACPVPGTLHRKQALSPQGRWSWRGRGLAFVCPSHTGGVGVRAKCGTLSPPLQTLNSWGTKGVPSIPRALRGASGPFLVNSCPGDRNWGVGGSGAQQRKQLEPGCQLTACPPP